MRVGVIVPAKGPAPYLAEALRSAQGADAIVVVDHASEPPLAAVDGAQLLRIENGAGGPARARQAGLEALDTELIALLDADDVWEPGKLDAQRSAFASEDAAAVCFGRAEVIDGSGRPTGERL